MLALNCVPNEVPIFPPIDGFDVVAFATVVVFVGATDIGFAELTPPNEVPKDFPIEEAFDATDVAFEEAEEALEDELEDEPFELLLEEPPLEPQDPHFAMMI